MSAPPAAAGLGAGEIAVRSQSNFLVSFLFLSAERRRGLAAVYAFCRVADDAVDEAVDAAVAEQGVAFWRRELEAAADGTPVTAVGRELQAAMRAFGVPAAPLHALLDGVQRDVRPAGCADLAELEDYCRKVASAVGLACLPVFGVAGATAERYADRLGLALQLTNVLRDLRPDAEQGRVYVPRDWLQACGVAPEWLRRTPPTARPALAALTRRLHDEAERRFDEATAALRELPRRDRRRLLPARVMGAVYRAILRRLRARGGDLDAPRVRLSKATKLWLACRTALGLG